MSALSLRGVGHAYLGRTVIDAVDLHVQAGEVVALVGPSGCGKSTLVHIAAGVVAALRGRVARAYHRHGMVFQEPRLLPWASARDNIAYPLRIAGVGRRQRRERAAAGAPRRGRGGAGRGKYTVGVCAGVGRPHGREVAGGAAARVALAAEDLDKYPVELSGGERQRAAIARALVLEPDFVYFDEPFTALDAALKRRLQDLVIEASRAAHFGALFVTHDLMEAARIAHRIAVLDTRGRGIRGERPLAGEPWLRDDRRLFETVQGFLREDPLFRHVHDVDERHVA